MTFDDNSSIRYLLGEMDPSEKVLFEQRMQEDENLLIEVESLRTIHERISGLQPVSPPKSVSRQVLMKATHHLAMKERTRQRTVWMAAAATLLVLFVGGSWLLNEPAVSDTTAGAGALIEQTEPLETVDAATSFGTTTEMTRAGESQTRAGSDPSLQTASGETAVRVEPWVDYSEEIHFMDRYDQQQAGRFDSLLYQSIERLQPVQSQPVETREPTGGLHLTGQ